jgi:hypothetical protein
LGGICIGGAAAGTASMGDHFCFDSQSIGSLTIGGHQMTLPSAGTGLGSSFEGLPNIFQKNAKKC